MIWTATSTPAKSSEPTTLAKRMAERSTFGTR
jgi:hypothetical protein